MASRWMFFILLFLVVFLVDWYVFQAIRTVCQHLSGRNQSLIFFLYWGIFVLTAITMVVFPLTRGNNSYFKTYLVSTLLIIFASKLVVVVFLLVDDGIRLMKYIVNYFFSPAPQVPNLEKNVISRNECISKLGLMAAAIPFAAFVYGMVRGAFNYRIKKLAIHFPNLPPAFDGYRILQISDLHTGSFSGTAPLQQAVKLINQQEADLVFFTGDLVNNRAPEVFPHQPALSQIQAKDGIYSVLGNHDYGDYVRWESREAKRANLNQLKKAHGDMGWRLLLNETAIITRGKDKLAVIGVENWGHRMNFPKYGNLTQGYLGAMGLPFKILLSHDPSHWDGEINVRFPDIDLTLSGHTHGMQFGINIPGLRWSPVQYVYKQWAGLYQKGRQYLYVNTGLGFLGYPGRVGFLPEITVIELRSETHLAQVSTPDI